MLLLALLGLLACADSPPLPAPFGAPASPKADLDGDGEDAATDCDDADPAISSSAAESCNAVDDDCDGAIDESGCACAVATYGEHVFQLCTVDRSWADAAADCAQSGYHLADLDDAAENTWIWAEAEANYPASAWWMGYHDRDTEGSFTWDGGSTSTYTNWRRGEPNDYDGAEDCAAWVDDSAGLWNDKRCTEAYPYVCEAGCATASFWPDADADGHGAVSAGDSVRACTAPAGYAADATDCDDGDPAVSPDRPEICGGLDDDCDGLTDDADPDVDPATTIAWYADADGDGVGSGAATVACSPPADSASVDGDCDDADPARYPGATDTPGDDVDQDCDGADSCRYYLDGDGDGDGDPASALDDCAPVAGYVGTGADCDDADPAISSFAMEIWYDGIDQDCDGNDDDQDGDGDGVATDCDDDDPTRSTLTAERCNAGDDDCDGAIDEEGCPCTAASDDDRTWLFCTDLAHWDEALSACEAWGYALVDVEDANENTWLWAQAEALDPTSNWWIGLSDQAVEGTYTWASGSTSSYTAWRGGEPNDYGGAEDCAAWAAGYSGQWNDKDCDTSYPFVCELGCLALDTWPDADGDGYGDDASASTRTCTPAASAALVGGDCDDSDVAVSPDAAEICNGVDDDCDGLLNDADPDVDLTTTANWYPDGDRDGWGAGVPTFACDQPTDSSALDGDCDDTDGSVYPDALDPAGDGIDQDCDGADDCRYYADADGDGYGDPAVSVQDCTPLPGMVADSSDCDDGDATISPSAVETWYDGLDQDCDGNDDDQDADGDPLGSDCDDTDPARATVLAERCDAVDNNCNDTIDEAGCPCTALVYGDHTYQLCAESVTWQSAADACATYGYHLVDVDDSTENAAIWAAAEATDPETSWWLGLADIDLEGTFTWDGGSASSFTDWRSGEPNDYGGDEDCAVWADNAGGQWNDKDCDDTYAYVCEVGCPTSAWAADADGDGAGDPLGAVVWACDPPAGTGPATDCDDTDATVGPDAAEVCDGDGAGGGQDDDCDGLIDDADPDVDLDTALSWYADADGDGFGAGAGSVACTAPAGTVADGGDCDDAAADTFPGALDPAGDGVDQDCDGADDCSWYTDADGDGWGDPATLVEDCTQPNDTVGVGGDCDDADAAISPGAVEIWYDGTDQDCDGTDDDQDGDGDPVATDCDDTDPARASTAAESCDGIDNDCDAEIDEEGCAVDPWRYDAHVYLFVGAGATWAEAQAACAAVGYHLVDLVDGLENDAVWAQAEATNPSAGWWIGLSDQTTEGVFAWDGGSTSLYTNWKEGEPNDYGGDEDCAAWVDDSGGLWNDKGCDDLFAYVCEAGCDAVDWYLDDDGDGFGGATLLERGCDAPTDGAASADDCDDARAEVYPGAPELQDGLDNDCDGAIEVPDADEDGASDADEALWGTDPADPDSDDDTLLDGDERDDDHDADGTIDALDPDDDGDGIPTAEEATLDVNGDGVAETDPDEDGVSSWLDDDSDGDRVADADEAVGDCDEDGAPDWADDDACDGVGDSGHEDDSGNGGTLGETGLGEDSEGKAPDEGCGCGSGGGAGALLLGVLAMGRRRAGRRP